RAPLTFECAFYRTNSQKGHLTLHAYPGARGSGATPGIRRIRSGVGPGIRGTPLLHTSTLPGMRQMSQAFVEIFEKTFFLM
ncbi:MAG TPA: hypothetical protein VF482_11710, partial [Trebonia sp.]